MLKQITREEFEALAQAHTVVEERDTEYSYECVVDATGAELAFAVCRTGEWPAYFARNGG